MDFAEQEIDIFGDGDYSNDEGQGENEEKQQTHQSSTPSSSSSGSSSPSSSSNHSGSSGRSGSGSGSGSESGSGSDGEEEEDDEDNGEVRSNYNNSHNENDDDDDKYLFGSDNEEHCKTPSKSPFLVPVLPPIRNSNNQGGGFGRGRWQNDRGAGILPRPGPYPQRHGYGHGSKFINGRHDDHFVSELKLAKSEETLTRKCIQFQEPCELACYSHAEGGDVYFDDRSLRLFKWLITEDVGADLNEGFDTFIEKQGISSD
ncbi:unnamed protein product [Ilex paraguariensis]|uniref:Uncharacterized protein n=1 Tax=Ilex paraguariensis TaxID=185542 RepID=A0ABC8TW55_9AQUA